MNYYIREAEITDAKAIHDIYGYYASNTYITFTEINPSVEEYQENIVNTKKHYPYIVLCDENDTVLGMAYADQIRHHDAYRFSVESTIYLSHDAPKQAGLGTMLYKALEERLSAIGYKFMYGVITDDNEASIRLHQSLGFSEVGHFTDIGYKFNNWKGIVWYRKKIGSLDDMTLNI
ncbi:phosphinothricin acetyltransferase [Pseudobutyrivibrio sp. ACV-2]|uniref:GNAT family N-acetyltransferase n=1 Tax=Pseudobutyrivibrio sp. ACV-2 TaxID=1520801 RepID=UPI00089AD4DA|nr:GNAT family N-acetyltransferase [Pseudobutyrivibrio sp. ACV-2]SDZ78820.1 phosphinothricin acetyltransferase [Pseudobutyrivibrio sp. ACV-2]